MDIMPTRYESLAATIAGYEQSRIPLVALADGRYAAAGYSDSKGLHYAVPRLVETFGLSLQTAIDVVLWGTLFAGFAVGLAGLLLLCPTARQRIVAVAQWSLLLAYSLAAVRDVYVFGVAVTVAVVPWGLLVLRRGDRPQRAIAFCVAAGLAVGCAHQFRAQAGAGAGALLVLLIWLEAGRPVPWRGALTAMLCGAALLPSLWFERLSSERDAFLAAHSPEYFARTQGAWGGAPWHSVYIGLGFLNNPWVAEYRDDVAVARVRQVRPEAAYLSREYQAVLRRDVLRLAGSHPGFVVRTLSAKAGVLLFWVLVFGNAGLLRAVQRGGWGRLDFAFAAAALCASLPGLLVMPLPHYVSSLLALATIYGIVRLNDAASARLTTADSEPPLPRLSGVVRWPGCETTAPLARPQ
ncbi:MAG TPA: hypothetical protein VML55_15460 [Planctomycetaceae bacterium]|nr:hypothetical protein [Planctomycetaceae bacterium]